MRRFRHAAILAVVALGACDGGGPGTFPPTSQAPPGTAAAPAGLPVPRTEVAGAVLGSTIVVVGGLLGDGGASERVDAYEPATNAWTSWPPLPGGVHHAGVASLKERLYVVGGYTNRAGEAWRELDRVVSIAPGENRWRPEPALRAPRAALGLAAARGRLVAFGGVSAGAVVETAEALDPGAPAWAALAPMSRRREHTAAAAAGGRVYAIGGRVGTLESNLASVESLDPAGGGWRQEPDLNDSRGGTAAAAVGDEVCVAGGEEPAGTIGSVECLRGGGWRRVGRLAEPRHGLAVVAVGRRLHLIAGGAQPGLFVSGTHEVLDL